MSEVNKTAQRIVYLLRQLPTPREAAAAIAVVRANMHVDGGGTTEKKVREMMAEDDKAAFEIWTTITEQNLRH